MYENESEACKPSTGWIGVDLDGTLIRCDEWHGMGFIGSPIPAMSDHVKRWLSDGWEVRIFTARVSSLYNPSASKAKRMAAQKAQWAIEDWSKEHFGTILPVTALIDFNMRMLFDDRCIQVETGTGRLMAKEPADDLPPIEEFSEGRLLTASPRGWMQWMNPSRSFLRSLMRINIWFGR